MINKTFASGAHRPVGFRQMLCTSESQESMQVPGIVNVIATEVGDG